MLFLHDLWYEFAGRKNRWPQNPMVFETKEALLAFWHRIAGSSWDELNVTGNDMRANFIEAFSRSVAKTPEGLMNGKDFDGDVVLSTHKVFSTRRYLVMDEEGRKLDPRDWGLPIQPLPAGPVVRMIYDNGAKRHYHRVSGPAFWRGVLRADMNRSFETDDDIASAPGVRRKALLSIYEKNDVYDRRRFRKSTKSWKDASKASRQYLRHKKPGRQPLSRKNSPWGSLAADGFPVSETTLELELSA